MKYFLILFLGISIVLSGQVQNTFPYKNLDLSDQLLNEDTFYEGQVNKDEVYKIKFESVKKDLQKPERYLVIGVTEFKEKLKKFEGEIIFKEKFRVRDSVDGILLFGDFNFKEKTDQDPGIFKGKIRIQTDETLVKSSMAGNVTFKGALEKQDGEIDQLWFGNFFHNDIDKVIFR